jgi:hypothetical protein
MRDEVVDDSGGAGDRGVMSRPCTPCGPPLPPLPPRPCWLSCCRCTRRWRGRAPPPSRRSRSCRWGARGGGGPRGDGGLRAVVEVVGGILCVRVLGGERSKGRWAARCAAPQGPVSLLTAAQRLISTCPARAPSPPLSWFTIGYTSLRPPSNPAPLPQNTWSTHTHSRQRNHHQPTLLSYPSTHPCNRFPLLNTL